MNFLEKDLETIIWENPEACVQRGLDGLNYNPSLGGKHFRQLNLAPYGVADLASVYYDAESDTVWIQVIECKKGKVDADTYMQAKRYAAAMWQFIAKSMQAPKNLHVTILLVGASVDTSGPLAFAIGQDSKCTTYTYGYGFDGIRFENADQAWQARAFVEYAPFVDETFHEIEFYRLTQFGKWMQAQQAGGDRFSPLLITAEGVLLNTDFIERDSYGSAD